MKKFTLCIGLIVSLHVWASDSTMAQEILQQVNLYRIAKGLPALKMEQALTKEAIHHSQDMAKHIMPFGHEGFAARIQRIHTQLPHSSNAAENVAYNYKTAKIVVDGWMHSPGHRRNILGHYDLTGIGLVRDAQGKMYFTQLFVKQSV